MILNKEDYFKNYGFKEDPFASTNSLHEEMLQEYFIIPPYFYSLVGSINKPKSSIVIAPRGTGKTAQRIMLEKKSEIEPQLITIVYDQFPIEGISDVKEISLDIHLIRIIKYLLIALLTELHEREIEKALNSYERVKLKELIEKYLNGINSYELNSAISSIKGVSGKLYDVWLKAGKPINSIINSIMKSKGLHGIDLVQEGNSYKGISYDEISSHLDYIEDLFNSIGIKSVFILVDRIDETTLTGNDSKKSYELIMPLIKDLRVLERKLLVFKFFLWDKIQEHWVDDIRKDRIDIFYIKWNQEEIKELMTRRLKAYSDGKVTELKQIMNCDDEIINLIYIFANKSPRDLINIVKSIFNNHLRTENDINAMPNIDTVIKGIEEFCKNKFDEMIYNEKQGKDLKRVKLATFTIPYLYNDVFKCSSSTARNTLMPWTRSGIVTTSNNKIKVSKSNNPINVYTFSDIRVARYVCSNQKFLEFIERNLIVCEECKTVNIFDKENSYDLSNWQCVNCLSELNI